MGTGKWPYLDVVWVAFETGSLLAVVGGGAVRGFRREALSTIKAAGLGHVPGDVTSWCQGCFSKWRQCGSPFLGQQENSSFHPSLRGEFKPSKQRRVRSCCSRSYDPQAATGQSSVSTAAVGYAVPQTPSPPRERMCQSSAGCMTNHEPRGFLLFAHQFAFPAQVNGAGASYNTPEGSGGVCPCHCWVQHFLPESWSSGWGCSHSTPATAVSNCNLTQPAIKHSKTGQSSV